MRSVVLYIAMSLDGYIAKLDGSVDWLQGQMPDIEDDSYDQFIQGVDTVIMGRTTYHQVVTELSPSEWVYENLMTYVMTHRECKDQKNIKFINKPVSDLIYQLKKENGKDIWICGGANLIHQMMCNDLIDEYRISIIPTLLGNGIRLFDTLNKVQLLEAVDTRHKNGIVEIIYKRREKDSDSK